MPHAIPPNVSHDTPELDCLDFSGETTYGDFRDDIVRDGYAVVKNVISPERAAHYVGALATIRSRAAVPSRSDMFHLRRRHSHLARELRPRLRPQRPVHGQGRVPSHHHRKGVGPGVRRSPRGAFISRATKILYREVFPTLDFRVADNLRPYLCLQSFTWGVRSEPGVIGAFEKIFNTDDLLVSFDAVNVSLAGRLDKKYEEFKPWAHQDQDPERPGFRCIQGFVNLLPNGDNDGGLMVLKGGHLVSEEYHKAFSEEEREFRWTNEVSARRLLLILLVSLLTLFFTSCADVPLQGHRHEVVGRQGSRMGQGERRARRSCPLYVSSSAFPVLANSRLS